MTVASSSTNEYKTRTSSQIPLPLRPRVPTSLRTPLTRVPYADCPHTTMVKFYGFLVDEDWLLKRGLEKKLGPGNTPMERDCTAVRAAWDILDDIGAGECGNVTRVVTKKGHSYWCIALASSDPYESVYTPRNMPPQEMMDAVKAALEKPDDIVPKWWPCAF
ncbi:hypothetical protein OBBRIDRAFT_100911 [Obba rivulosa]|uniref:Uncharacterized protein n=1 Tax=Obba rivulosa TaxID=1052685 RepID=A0A8E2DRT3_9APHY|nr:hypothetical protein OBBRIDRAFT_100911 [Obba rivulosa]